MIQVKNTEVLESMLIHPAHPKLTKLMQWVCVRCSQVIWTGMFEERDYPSVHSTIPVRGSDMRSRIYQDPQAVVNDINVHWIYDPDRPWMKCAVYHNTGRGWHIHLQVHDHTTKREE